MLARRSLPVKSVSSQRSSYAQSAEGDEDDEDEDDDDDYDGEPVYLVHGVGLPAQGRQGWWAPW